MSEALIVTDRDRELARFIVSQFPPGVLSEEAVAMNLALERAADDFREWETE